MARLLKTNTATRISLGPFLDATDGVTPEVALTVSATAVTAIAETDDNSDPTLVLDSVAGDDATNTLAHITNDGAGYYGYKLTAANLNRLGRFRVCAIGAAHCPVFQDYVIVPAKIYDSAVLGTDNLEVDTIQWLGTAAATPTVAGVPEVDVTHWIGTAAATPTVAGVPEVDITHIAGSAVSTSSAQLGVNVVTHTGNVGVKKNTALSAFMFQMFDSTTHAPVTGKTVTVTRSLDGAAFAAGTLSAVTEVANGWYKVDFGAGDLNANVVAFRATAATSDDTNISIVTGP